MSAGLQEALEKAIPHSLDDIVRIRRDELSLRLSTAEDIAELPPIVSMLDNQKQIKATVNEWRIVCLCTKGKKEHMLTGIDESTGNVWGTSFVRSVDFDNNLLLTENSIYRLGTKGDDEPTLHILFHICYMFHKWGFGSRFGVPAIFY